MSKPEDLIDSFILNDHPLPLKIHTGLSEDELMYLSPTVTKDSSAPRKRRKEYERPRDSDYNEGGHVDDAGNFSMSRKPRATVQWYVRRNTEIKGPFTNDEVKKMASADELEEAEIKRSFDRGYVDASKLIAEHPYFYESKGLNQFFIDNQKIEEGEDKREEFFNETVSMNVSPKLMNFFKTYRINTTGDYLIRYLKGMKKSAAIGALKNVTGLERPENEMLIDLLIEESKEKFLSDVDKNGFMMNTNKSKGGPRKL